MSTAGEVDETLAEADDFARRVGTANSTGPGPLLPTDDLTEDLV